MRTLLKSICVAAAVMAAATSYARALYLNEEAPVSARVADLLGRMTVEEKIDLLRVSIPAGKSRHVAIGIPKETLRYWAEKTERYVTLPRGSYDVTAGASSADIRLRGSLSVR